MNIQRMIKAAEFMLKVHENGDGFNLSAWRVNGSGETYSQLHRCKGTACFGGWLAVSPEFRRAGGSVCDWGQSPEFKGAWQEWAVAEYFDISVGLSQRLTMPGRAKRFYKKRALDVTALDVANKLLELVKAEVQ